MVAGVLRRTGWVTGDLGYNKAEVRAVRPVAVLRLYGRREKSGLARAGAYKARPGKAARAKNPRGGVAQAPRHVKYNREQTSRWLESQARGLVSSTGDG